MTVCRTDNVKIFQETIHLPYCFVVQIKSDVNPLAEASEVSYAWGWPAWSWMVCTLVLGSAWYLVLRQTGGWSSSKGLASSWHQPVIYRIKHSSHSYLPGKRREQRRFNCTHNKESLYPLQILLKIWRNAPLVLVQIVSSSSHHLWES